MASAVNIALTVRQSWLVPVLWLGLDLFVCLYKDSSFNAEIVLIVDFKSKMKRPAH